MHAAMPTRQHDSDGARRINGYFSNLSPVGGLQARTKLRNQANHPVGRLRGQSRDADSPDMLAGDDTNCRPKNVRYLQTFNEALRPTAAVGGLPLGCCLHRSERIDHNNDCTYEPLFMRGHACGGRPPTDREGSCGCVW